MIRAWPSPPSAGAPGCSRLWARSRVRTARAGLLVSLLLALAPAYDPIRPALDTFLAELERLPTGAARRITAKGLFAGIGIDVF
jgi:hypothetical protein